jgi:hypothetical protein
MLGNNHKKVKDCMQKSNTVVLVILVLNVFLSKLMTKEGYSKSSKTKLILPQLFLGSVSERINFADRDDKCTEWVVRKTALLDKRFIKRLNNQPLILRILHIPRSSFMYFCLCMYISGF